MKEPEIPINETERMELIRQLNILDTASEEIYDGIVYVAAMICQTPISTITIVDKERQWFKSVVGGNEKENPRAFSFCAHAILQEKILEVPDSQKDERFKDNPLVLGDPHVRFYAGVPLELKDGLRVGTLCVIDQKPNKLNDEQLKALYFLGQQVTKLLELRLKVNEVENLRENDTNIVNMLTHELRSPLTSISGFLSLAKAVKETYHDPNYDVIIEKCLKNTERMLRIVNEFLNFSHWKDSFWALQKQKNDLNNCIRDSVSFAKGYLEKCKVSVELCLDENIPKIEFDPPSILAVLENLLSNAAKFSHERGKIIIYSEIFNDFVKVRVRDFGLGIPENAQTKIFKPFALYSHVNRVGIKGSGLGLSVAKKIIDKHGGELNFETAENKGTTFYFTLPV